MGTAGGAHNRKSWFESGLELYLGGSCASRSFYVCARQAGSENEREEPPIKTGGAWIKTVCAVGGAGAVPNGRLCDLNWLFLRMQGQNSCILMRHPVQCAL